MRVSFADLPQFSNHVLVDGSFDPFHTGHLAYLQAAAHLGHPLLVAVASDEWIRDKGGIPFFPQAHRVTLLEALQGVHAVYAKDRPTEQILSHLRPKAYVKGADWRDRLPPAQVEVCAQYGITIHFTDTVHNSSGARLRAWAAATDARALDELERLVQAQQPAVTPWQPVTDYSFEARQAIEGRHPELIKDVFQPRCVVDVGCGPGHLVKMLRDLGVKAYGYDKEKQEREHEQRWFRTHDVSQESLLDDERIVPSTIDLVICREVLEHLTARQLRIAVTNLCRLSSKFVYVTTRFAKQPSSLLSVDTSDNLDPTHITLLNQDLLRTLFVLEGAKRRADLETRMDWQGKGRVLVYEV